MSRETVYYAQKIDGASDSSGKAFVILNQGTSASLWDAQLEDTNARTQTSDNGLSENHLAAMLVHQSKNTIVVTPDTSNDKTVFNLHNNERLQDRSSTKSVEGLNLTYVTPKKKFGHRDDASLHDVFAFYGSSGGKLVELQMDYKMRDGVVRNYAGQPMYSGSRAFTSYSVCHISPFARREAGFMALCDDGKVRRYDKQLSSYEGDGACANAMYGLKDTYGVKPDANITHVDVKADGQWMVLTTDNAVYLASVDNKDPKIARLDMDPKKKPKGNFKFMKAMFDTSIEVDVENTDMTENYVGAYITEEDEDEPTMVTWNLRKILKGTPERLVGGDDLPEGENLVVFTKKDQQGTTKKYGEFHSSPQAAQPAANNENVDDWTYVAAGNRGTALFSVAALADGIKTMTV